MSGLDRQRGDVPKEGPEQGDHYCFRHEVDAGAMGRVTTYYCGHVCTGVERASPRGGQSQGRWTGISDAHPLTFWGGEAEGEREYRERGCKADES